MVFGDHEIVHHPLSLIRERSPVTGRGGVFSWEGAPDADWGGGGGGGGRGWGGGAGGGGAGGGGLDTGHGSNVICSYLWAEYPTLIGNVCL